MQNIKVAFYTLGCKLNQAETESLVGQFSEAGFQLVPPDALADIYVANTCTVTHIADRKSRHWLRLARRRNPQAFIIAVGCYSQRAPEELAPIADLVLGNEEKERLLEIVASLLPTRPLFIMASEVKQSHAPWQVSGAVRGASPMSLKGVSRVRSLIKIQDGCHSPCTYCVVPSVRTCGCSMLASQIIGEIKRKVALGYKEVVLTGTKVGCYKDDSTALGDLIECVLRDTSIERLRLSSLQPQELSSKLVFLWQDAVLSRRPERSEGTSEGARLCRHFHLALQSGSGTVLQRMRRCYSLDDYQEAMAVIRQIPGVAITTDIMVGFPGESDEEFERSYRFCQQAGFANIHVFPFSPRPGTAAAKMSNQIGDEVKKERSRRMLKLSWISKRNFEEQFLGQTMPVLWEKEVNLGEGIYSGLTDNYIRVFTRSEKPLTNKLLPAKLMEFYDLGVWGELVSESSTGPY